MVLFPAVTFSFSLIFLEHILLTVSYDRDIKGKKGWLI